VLRPRVEERLSRVQLSSISCSACLYPWDSERFSKRERSPATECGAPLRPGRPRTSSPPRGVEPLVERIALGKQADLERAVAAQRAAALAEQFAHGPPHQQGDFQGAGHFGDVVGMNRARGRGIETGVSRRCSEPGRRSSLAASRSRKRLVARRAFEQAVPEERVGRSRCLRRLWGGGRAPKCRRWPRAPAAHTHRR